MEKRLIHDAASSRKFWNIVVQGTSFTVHYGRIGTDGRTSEKTFDSGSAAREAAEKLIASKVRKGYVEEGPAKSKAPPKESSAKKAKANTEETRSKATDYAALVADRRDFVAELRESSRFTVEARFGKPASERSMQRAEKDRGKALPEALKEFLRAVDGFDVEIAEADPAHRAFEELGVPNPTITSRPRKRSRSTVTIVSFCGSTVTTRTSRDATS